jgi:antitoxin HicB
MDEAFVEAVDCLDSYLCINMQLKEPIAPPSRPRRGAKLIPVPLYLAPKIALYMAMQEQKVTNAELARRLRVRETIVRRLLDPRHESRAESLQKALAALGRSIVVSIDSAA